MWGRIVLHPVDVPLKIAFRDSVAEAAAGAGGAKTYEIRFVPGRQLFQFANEPLLFIRELKTFGELAVEVDASALPPLDQLEAEDSYLSCRFTLVTVRTADDIAEVFEFVVDDATIEIAEIADDAAADPATRSPDTAAAAVSPDAAPAAGMPAELQKGAPSRGAPAEAGEKSNVTSRSSAAQP